MSLFRGVFDSSSSGGDIAGDTHAATSKSTPVDADELPISDSAASWGLKKLTWANLKATLQSVFATLAGKSGGQTLIGGTGVTDKLVLQGTSGNGTSTASALYVNVGNNGATNALTVLNDGKVGIGASSLDSKLVVNASDGRLLTLGGVTGGAGKQRFLSFQDGTNIQWRANMQADDTTRDVSANPAYGLALDSRAANTGGFMISYWPPVSGVAAKILQINNAFFKISDYFGNSRFYLNQTTGDLGLGIDTPSARVHAIKTTEQWRIGYDASYYASFTVSSAGNLTLTNTGTTIYTDKVIENTVNGAGIVLKSPDGTRYSLTVANGGTLSIAAA